jgi:hypothetical protein
LVIRIFRTTVLSETAGADDGLIDKACIDGEDRGKHIALWF